MRHLLFEPGFMTKTSLDKSKIKILLLEGIHPSAVEAFRADGYTDIEYHPKSLARVAIAGIRRRRLSSWHSIRHSIDRRGIRSMLRA